MKKLITVTLWLCSVLVAHAQNDFEWEKAVRNVKATVKVLEDKETFVLVPEAESNKRYISAQLPAEYKKDGLQVTYNGMIGKIPPHVRMLGTPLKITKIWISRTEKKKHNLSNRCYKA